jgi:uncharacterized protein YbaR (Trm112 family)
VLLALVDSLRCPVDHEESVLVLSADSWAGSRVASGTLGCPVCHARYAIRDGAVDFTGGAPGDFPLPAQPLESDGMRLAAQLGLGEPGGLVMLTGRYAVLAEALGEVVDVTCIVVDTVRAPQATVRFELRDRIPLPDATLRGAAIDEPRATPPFLAEVTRCMQAGGRVVAPARSWVPDGARLIARDEQEWVAEVEGSVPVIQLRRVPR